MNDKYFIPDIEDIRIGYEMEGKIYNEDKWIKIFIDTADWADQICNMKEDEHNNDIKIYTLPKDIYRVPYLTKEQIEAEGWKVVGSNNQFDYFTKDKYKLEFLINGYGGEDTVPYTISMGEDLYYPCYNGQCKDVNTFRWLCKLLKI